MQMATQTLSLAVAPSALPLLDEGQGNSTRPCHMDRTSRNLRMNLGKRSTHRHPSTTTPRGETYLKCMSYAFGLASSIGQRSPARNNSTPCMQLTINTGWTARAFFSVRVSGEATMETTTSAQWPILCLWNRNRWRNSLRSSQREMQLNQRDSMLDRQLDSWMDHARQRTGGSSSPPPPFAPPPRVNLTVRLLCSLNAALTIPIPELQQLDEQLAARAYGPKEISSPTSQNATSLTPAQPATSPNHPTRPSNA